MRSQWTVCCAAGLALLVPVLPALAAEGTTLDCLIEPYVTVAVTAPVEAVVERMEVERGDLVRKGQVLAILESSVDRATLAIARARAETESAIKSGKVRVEYGNKKVVSSEELLQQGGISIREVDEARAQRDLSEIGLLEAQENKRQAELEVQRSEAAVALRTVTSPIDGVVTERLLSPTEMAKQAPVVKVAQLDPLRVEVFAPIGLLGRLSVGMTAEVLPEPPIGGVYTAQVTVVDRVVDAASGTFGVRLELPNPGYRLPAGLKCKVRLAR
ncbi:MAG TPA: efflux RND transporter periplasmic adaptor subunit [Candidatus Methylomirabilis sp.]|nr:efflux RND transporter periplasmic adaptor subunit [Candidatus Methylomirabilis sp.]